MHDVFVIMIKLFHEISSVGLDSSDSNAKLLEWEFSMRSKLQEDMKPLTSGLLLEKC